MRDVITDIDRWLGLGQAVALATVAKVWGSAPRPVGAKMAISAAGELAGSVSGGCVEGAVVEEAQRVLATAEPKLLRFAVSDEEAWAVGLSCGGEIEVYVEALAASGAPPHGSRGDEIFAALRAALAEERLVALATVVAGPAQGARLLLRGDGESRGNLPPALAAAVRSAMAELLAAQRTERRSFTAGGETNEVLIEVHPPPAKLILIGAVHTAVALVSLARVLGYRTIVVDPRGAFASPERFAHADALVPEWPDEALPKLGLDEATAVVLLSHDLKIDLPALRLVLRSPVRYVGALGSRKTHAKRVAALAEEGFTAAEIARIHAPVGLPLGGKRPEEIALAVLAEIVAVEHGAELRYGEPMKVES